MIPVAATHLLKGVLMRITALLGIALVAAACSTKEAPPAADTTAAAPEPAPAPALSLEAAAGKWNTNVMALDKDSVLTTHVLTATADTAGWSLQQPTGAVVPLHNVMLDGDSITAQAGGFKSGVRSGMTVKDLRVTYRLQDGRMVGTATARYETKTADSVRQFRFVGTKQ